jgi:mRNA-degrading endonuclease RelE of RelBE toxin-antitoxin system
MGEPTFNPDALAGLTEAECKRIKDKVGWLWDNRREVLHHPLRHDFSGLYKRVLGKYRILYTYDENSDEMVVHIAGTRDTIYEDAIKKLL